MSKITSLKEELTRLYISKHPDRAEWADWIWEGHAIPVGNASREVAIRFGGNPDLAEAGGLLHDVADSIMKREDPQHETVSMNMARELLQKAGYSKQEIAIVVDDAIRNHSCRGDNRPKTSEGKAVAAGDALAHLTTDFYLVAEERRKKFQTSKEISEWVLPKIERDFTNKIAWNELREEVRPQYEALKAHFQ